MKILSFIIGSLFLDMVVSESLLYNAEVEPYLDVVQEARNMCVADHIPAVGTVLDALVSSLAGDMLSATRCQIRTHNHCSGKPR